MVGWPDTATVFGAGRAGCRHRGCTGCAIVRRSWPCLGLGVGERITGAGPGNKAGTGHKSDAAHGAGFIPAGFKAAQVIQNDAAPAPDQVFNLAQQLVEGGIDDIAPFRIGRAAAGIAGIDPTLLGKDRLADVVLESGPIEKAGGAGLLIGREGLARRSMQNFADVDRGVGPGHRAELAVMNRRHAEQDLMQQAVAPTDE